MNVRIPIDDNERWFELEEIIKGHYEKKEFNKPFRKFLKPGVRNYNMEIDEYEYVTIKSIFEIGEFIAIDPEYQEHEQLIYKPDLLDVLFGLVKERIIKDSTIEARTFVPKIYPNETREQKEKLIHELKVERGKLDAIHDKLVEEGLLSPLDRSQNFENLFDGLLKYDIGFLPNVFWNIAYQKHFSNSTKTDLNYLAETAAQFPKAHSWFRNRWKTYFALVMKVKLLEGSENQEQQKHSIEHFTRTKKPIKHIVLADLFQYETNLMPFNGYSQDNVKNFCITHRSEVSGYKEPISPKSYLRTWIELNNDLQNDDLDKEILMKASGLFEDKTNPAFLLIEEKLALL